MTLLDVGRGIEGQPTNAANTCWMRERETSRNTVSMTAYIMYMWDILNLGIHVKTMLNIYYFMGIVHRAPTRPFGAIATVGVVGTDRL
jgi:hypothetical protein